MCWAVIRARLAAGRIAVTLISTRILGQTSAGTTASMNTGWWVMIYDRKAA
jgi:hypothetical protein